MTPYAGKAKSYQTILFLYEISSVQHLLARYNSAVKNRVQIIKLQQKFKTFNCFQQKQHSKCSITDRIQINIPAGFP